MSQVRLLLRRRERIADQTMAFFFEKPRGFQFTPGQTIDVSLIDPPESDFERDTPTFSIASAPHEPDIMIATRMRGSAFKRVLAAMPIVPTITHLDADPSWRGETGRIDLDMIRRHAVQAGRPVYYLAGPSTMVASLHDALIAAGIPTPDVRVEEFAGYA